MDCCCEGKWKTPMDRIVHSCLSSVLSCNFMTPRQLHPEREGGLLGNFEWDHSLSFLSSFLQWVLQKELLYVMGLFHFLFCTVCTSSSSRILTWKSWKWFPLSSFNPHHNRSHFSCLLLFFHFFQCSCHIHFLDSHCRNSRSLLWFEIRLFFFLLFYPYFADD